MVQLSNVKCDHCFADCYGDIISAHGKYYHQTCFSCAVGGCDQSLIQTGFFFSEGKFYCTDDYHKLLGTQCKRCRNYVEGDTISAINSLYHPDCFACERCRLPFQANVEICFDGKDLFCSSCYVSTNDKKSVNNNNNNNNNNGNKPGNVNNITKSTTNNKPENNNNNANNSTNNNYGNKMVNNNNNNTNKTENNNSNSNNNNNTNTNNNNNNDHNNNNNNNNNNANNSTNDNYGNKMANNNNNNNENKSEKNDVNVNHLENNNVKNVNKSISNNISNGNKSEVNTVNNDNKSQSNIINNGNKSQVNTVNNDNKSQVNTVNNDNKSQSNIINNDNKSQVNNMNNDNKPQGNIMNNDNKPQGNIMNNDNKSQVNNMNSDNKSHGGRCQGNNTNNGNKPEVNNINNGSKVVTNINNENKPEVNNINNGSKVVTNINNENKLSNYNNNHVNKSVNKTSRNAYDNNKTTPSICAGCDNGIKSDQSLLLALEKQWHLWCFNCYKCGMLLAGDYMVRDGMPYCEQDYQTEFGVSCASCGGYITGKVLQAGDKHYHPSCSHCAKCGQIFGEGEEMYLQGSEIWHPECCEDLQQQVEGSDLTRDSEFDITPIDYGDFSFSLNDSSDSFRHFVEREELKDQVDGKRKTINGPVYNILSSSSSSINGNGNVKPVPSRPPGFRSVKPPQTYSTLPEKKSVARKNREENAPPPVPAPPTRSSSKLFLQKYNSGVYGATPFQKATTITHPPAENHPAVTYRRPQNGTTDDGRRIGKSPRPLSSSTPTLSHNDEGESSSSNDSPNHCKRYQKGVGYNKLQRRRSLRDENRMKLPTNIDPDRLRKFLEDPDHNVYLEDREFYQVFKITREKYYALPQGKKEELKKEALKCFSWSSA